MTSTPPNPETKLRSEFRECDNDTSNPSASPTPLEENPIGYCQRLLPAKLIDQQVQNRKLTRTKRNATVISPFSERRQTFAEKEISVTCQPKPLQTTGGFFKGKPPITPFTRLGCFRMQLNKASNFSAKTTVGEKRCCLTADVPQMVKPQLERRPASHVPQQNQFLPSGSEVQRPTPPQLKSSSSRRATDIHKENSVQSFPNRLPRVGTSHKCKQQKQRLQVGSLKYASSRDRGRRQLREIGGQS